MHSILVLICIVVDCSTLTNLTNGQVNLDLTTFGAMANYSCNEGYILLGPNARICQSNGSWTEDVPVCQSKSLPLHLGNSGTFLSFFFCLFSCGLFESDCSKQWSGITDNDHLWVNSYILLCGRLFSVG